MRLPILWSLALAHGRASRTTHHSKAQLIEQFNLSHARAGPEAVDEAVSFILQQEKATEHLAHEAGHHAAHANATYADAPPATAGGAPTCAVSYERIRRDGVFVHRGRDAPPPYEEVTYSELVEQVSKSPAVGEDTLVVIEYPVELGCFPPVLAEGQLVGLRNRRYGRTVIGVYVNRPSGRLDMQPWSEEFVSV